MTNTFSFRSKLWRYKEDSGWFFYSLPKKTSKAIRRNFKDNEEGWGRLKVLVKIGESKWQSAIWFDTKFDTYLLPVKLEIRKKEKLIVGKFTKIEIGPLSF